MDAVQVPEQARAGLQKLQCQNLHAEQNGSRQIEQLNRPAVLEGKSPPLGEGQYKVEEERGLQQPGDLVAPQDYPVEAVELAGKVQRVEDKRDQAEDIKVQGTDCRPAPQQYLEANAQVDERDQPQPIVHGALGGHQYDFNVQRNSAADQRVGCLGIDADRKSVV